MRKKFTLNGICNDDCPCKDCHDRFVSCHSYCSNYIKWKAEHNEILEKNRQEYLINDTLYDNQTRRNKKIHQEGGVKYGRRGNDTR